MDSAGPTQGWGHTSMAWRPGQLQGALSCGHSQMRVDTAEEDSGSQPHILESLVPDPEVGQLREGETD